MDTVVLLAFVVLVIAAPIVLLLRNYLRTPAPAFTPLSTGDGGLPHVAEMGGVWDSLAGPLSTEINSHLREQHGAGLDARADAMRAWAETVDGQYVTLDRVLLTGGDAERVLFSDGIAWQARNRTVLSRRVGSDEVAVTVADINRMSLVRTEVTLAPTTAAVVWFDTGYRLTAAPPFYLGISSTQYGTSGLRVGPPVPTGVKEVDDRYEVRSEHTGFAHLFLNPAVQARLAAQPDRILVITDGLMVLATGYGWLPPEQIDAFVEDLLFYAWSGRAAAATRPGQKPSP